MKKDIWVLTDHRTGNSNQALALAQSLPCAYEVKYLEYNLLARLPNFLIRGTNCFIKEHTNQSLNPPYPKAIISTGRRCAALALYLKNLSPETKIIQLMKPDSPPNLFDLIVLPQHDNFKGAGQNVGYIIGALNNIQKRFTAASQEQFIKHYPQTKDGFISVLIGGATKKDSFSSGESQKLAQQISDICNHHSLPAFISFSRRTTQPLKDAFKTIFGDKSHIIFDPSESDSQYNPYIGMLAHGSFILCSGDSISMCSEAVATGKPVYIFTPETFVSSKHKYFIQQLIDLGMARKLEQNLEHLTKYQYTPLNEANQITQRIVDLLDIH